MAPPVYQAVVDTGGATAANFTVPSLTAAAGDVIVVGAFLEPSVVVTPPDGTWTEKTTSATTGTRLRVFWHRAAGAETTYVFTHSSTFRQALAVKISGAIASGDPFDQFDIEFDNAAGTATPACSFTTTLDDELLVWFATQINGGDNFVPPAGITERADAAPITVGTGPFLTAGATGSVAGTLPSSAERIAFLGSLKPVVASVPISFVPRAFRRQVGRLRTHSYVVMVPQAVAGAAGAVGAAAGAQRTSGTTTVRKEAVRAAAGANRVSGTASGVKGAQRAATASQRASGAVGSGKQVTAAAAGAQRTSGAVASRKQWVAAAAGAVRSSGAAAAVKKAIAAAAGALRSSGAAERAPAGPAAAAVGAQRISGATTGVKTVVRAAAGAQRTSGAATGVKTVTRAAASSQRTSGTASIRKQATTAATGPQRTAGAVVSFLFVGPNGPAAGHQRSSGTATGRKATTTTATTGQQRTSGQAAGIHRGVGVAQGRQRSSGATVIRKTAVRAAAGHQRTSGTSEFTTVPPPRWVEHDSTASGQVEGDSAGSGLVEGVLVAAGIVEGSSGL